MRTGALLLALTTSTAVLGAGTPARADWVSAKPREDPYARDHLYLGVAGTGTKMLGRTAECPLLGDGFGLSVFFGARLHRAFALEIGWHPSFHSPRTDLVVLGPQALPLQSLTVDAKFYPWSTPVQPYISMGTGAYLLRDAVGGFAFGPGYQLGAGLDLWLSPYFSLGVRAQYRGATLIRFDGGALEGPIAAVVGAAEFAGRF